ncbi:ATP-binding cassette domain-containing protein, partial [Proteus mirabilis]|uniref:ATP-binding cassette domain-containing protein n=1 Tax=Proteus mirabilis TaxID=584 RepID=UPI001EF7C25F
MPLTIDSSAKPFVILTVGVNGAGKTTVFNCLTGFYKATGGNILLNTQGRTTDVIQVLGEPFQLDDFV